MKTINSMMEEVRHRIDNEYQEVTFTVKNFSDLAKKHGKHPKSILNMLCKLVEYGALEIANKSRAHNESKIFRIIPGESCVCCISDVSSYYKNYRHINEKKGQILSAASLRLHRVVNLWAGNRA